MKISLELQPILKNKTGVGWYTQKIIEQFYNDKLEFEGLGFNFLSRNDIQNDIQKLRFKTKINSFMPYGAYRRAWEFIPFSYNLIFNSHSDIYHFFNYIVPPKIKGKVIVTVYDMVYKLYPETMTKNNYKRLDSGLKRSVDMADKIITISENSKKEIMEFLDVDQSKIEIVYPGIDRETYSYEYNENQVLRIKEKYNLPSKYILYLGTLEPRKNIDKIIDSYKLLINKGYDDIFLVISGSKGWMYEEIFSKVERYGIKDKVIFTGYVDEKDKPIIYKMSEMFVFPSLYEGFGIPVLEAMVSGVPVITSNTSSLPEVAGDAAILVDPNNLQEISSAMIRVLESEEVRKDLIQKGLKQSPKFCWQKSATKLLSIYKEVGKHE